MKLLFVDCCISQRGDNSRTSALCGAFIEAFTAEHKEAEVEKINLVESKIAPFDRAMLDERDRLFEAGRFDDKIYDMARQFAQADLIVVGAPFWDLSFPSQLRIYIEHISANGITYYYDEKGPHGKCKAKRLVFLTAGGDFERQNSLGKLYWQQLCTMYGIEKFDCVFAGGLDTEPQKASEFLEKSCEEARKIAKTI